jgi:hypothetical protein
MLEITAMDEILGWLSLDDVKSYNTIKDLLLYNNMLNYSKSADVK